MIRAFSSPLLLCSALLWLAAPAHAWESSAKWGGRVVGYQVNPQNLDVTEAQALKAIRWSADAWTNQTQAGFRFRYDGKTTDTQQGLNGKNLVVFRNEVGSSSTVRATTYSWKLFGLLIEADIVFWDKSMSYVTASMPCNKDIVIENTGIHEFGHALGLDHSDVTTATMWGKSSTCATSRLKLDPDDIEGIETLYPCTTAAQCDDGDICTKDTCQSKKCLRTPINGCCNVNADCDDSDPCTKDTCKSNSCTFKAISGCCTANADCDDNDPCTKDTCKSTACTSTPIPGCDAGPGDAGAADSGAVDSKAQASDAQVIADAGSTADRGTAQSDGSANTGPDMGESPSSSSSGCSVGAAPGTARGGSALLALLLLSLAIGRRRR